jgi:cytochrome c-type biogenesis protein
MADFDTSFVAAFAVGVVSFLSPCVLPLVPGYLSTVTGLSLSDLRSKRRGRLESLLPAVVFCLSFTAVFVALGMTATTLGGALQDRRALLDKVAGACIIALGVFFLIAPLIPRLAREWHVDGLLTRARSGSPIVAGAAFAVAWTPCIGPTLGAILNLAATQDGVARGGLLLAFYSAGLAVPFLLTAVAFSRMTRAFGWFREHQLLITVASGALLIAMGLLLLTGELKQLNIRAQEIMDGLGVNVFRDL